MDEVVELWGGSCWIEAVECECGVWKIDGDVVPLGGGAHDLA